MGINLSLKEDQYSISSICVQNSPPTKLNSIQALIGLSYFSFSLYQNYDFILILFSSFTGNFDIIDSKYNEIEAKPRDIKKYSDANSNCYDLRYHDYDDKLFIMVDQVDHNVFKNFIQ